MPAFRVALHRGRPLRTQRCAQCGGAIPEGRAWLIDGNTRQPYCTRAHADAVASVQADRAAERSAAKAMRQRVKQVKTRDKDKRGGRGRRRPEFRCASCRGWSPVPDRIWTVDGRAENACCSRRCAERLFQAKFVRRGGRA